jgi:hypothetical protein
MPKTVSAAGAQADQTDELPDYFTPRRRVHEPFQWPLTLMMALSLLCGTPLA